MKKKYKHLYGKERELISQWIKEYVLTRIKRYWSPEIITGRLSRFGINISYGAIYQFIYGRNRLLHHSKLIF